ncbi:MFS transporter small subunit [Micromonospora humida]
MRHPVVLRRWVRDDFRSWVSWSVPLGYGVVQTVLTAAKLFTG